MTFSELNIKLKKTSGQEKTLCPKCSHKRKKNTEPCLSVNIDEGVWQCKHCGWAGSLYTVDSKDKAYVLPKFNTTKLSDKLLAWFLDERKISQQTLKKNLIGEEIHYMPHAAKEMNCTVFNYFRGDKLVNKKWRSGDKGFSLVKGAELIFYNIDNIEEETIITEGEMDALALDEAGFSNAISVPNGATQGNNNLKYVDNCWDDFKDVKKIYLAMDADFNGANLLGELSRRFGKERCLIVKYPDGCGDANDVLVKEGRESLKDCIKNAEPFPLEGVIPADDIAKGLIKLYYGGTERGISVGLGKFDELCTFKTSMLYIITGVPVHGKSSFLNWLEVRLSALFGWKWGIFSPEHYPSEYLTYRYVEQLIGKPFFSGINIKVSKEELDQATQFIKDHFFIIRPKGEVFTLDKILETGRQLVGRYGIKGFTIDPWSMVHHDFGSYSETQYIEKALNKITLFKQENDLCVMLVAHPTKMRKIRDGESAGLFEVPNLYDISGSSHFFNKADVGICVYRNFLTKATDVYTQKVKFKNLGKMDWMSFSFDEINNRFHEEGTTHIVDSLLPRETQSEMDFSMQTGESDTVFSDV